MNQETMKKKWSQCADKAKMIDNFVYYLKNGSIQPEHVTSLWQMTGELHAMVTALRSEAVGNPPPEVG